jgi:putative nucleotidyltransferase with HDIG domain
VQSNGSVPLLEAEAVVRSLSVAMCADSPMVLPLLKLKEFDQYTTTHSLNVSVLSMGLAETLGFRSQDVRAIGVAGLLHDIGKVRIPIDILTKPGKLTDEERAIMNRHPVDGAQYLMQSHDDLSLAATVAYEHHILLDGGGYPTLHYKRDCATASRLVHVCDVFDALGTTRPYRGAWPMKDIFDYLEGRAGTEFDADLVSAFTRTMKQGSTQIRVLTDDRSAGVDASA